MTIIYSITFYITIYYIMMVIIIFQHIHVCEATLYIYWLKFYSYRPKYSVKIGILPLIVYFAKKAPVSHAKNLTNLRGVPELIQHARLGTELMSQNPKVYYHISAEYQGYDALSFKVDDYFRVRFEKSLSHIKLYEDKMVFGKRNLKADKIMKVQENYSLPKLEGPEKIYGPRPMAAHSVEFGAYRQEDYVTLSKIAEAKKAVIEPKIVIQDYSAVYEKLVWNTKHGRLEPETIISDLEFERLKYFYYLLDKNEPMCLIFNSLLENNPLFPL